MSFQGSVESFSLADVFQNLAMNQHTGTLRIYIPDGPARHIFFENGQVRYLSRGHEKPLLLGQILIGRGRATAQQIEEGLKRQKETGEPLGRCLVGLGYLDELVIDDTVKHQIEEEIYDLFSWERALFEFQNGPRPEALFSDQISSGGTRIPISHLIMEAARRVDEWDRLKQQVPSFREVYVLDPMVRKAVESGALEADLLERRLLGLVDGTRDIEALIEDSFLFRFEVLQALTRLLQASMIRPATPQELAQAAERLAAENNKPRYCKLLERQLAAGEDRPEIRQKLADLLAETGNVEKAAIHFGVLADQALQQGNEDGAVVLFKKILAAVPKHLASRERLGEIYARRGQVQEAVIQFRELVTAYRNHNHLVEARAACQRALEVDPGQIELRQDLIEICLKEGDKNGAARQHEVLGDQLASAGQTRQAADQYRKALQLCPNLGHLKPKLANVLLTQEDRRVRGRRAARVVVAVTVSLLLLVAVVVYEVKNKSAYDALRQQADQLAQTAQAEEKAERFDEAMQAYREALALFLNSGLKDRWTPILGSGRLAEEAIKEFSAKKEAAEIAFKALLSTHNQAGQEELTRGLEALEGMRIHQARDSFERILANKRVTEDLRAQASRHLQESQDLIRRFEAGLALLRQPPERAFQGVEEEFKFKDAFWQEFGRVPLLKETPLEMPVQVKTPLNGVQVYLEDQLLGTVNRGGANLLRYAPPKRLSFSFRKKGYETRQLLLQRPECFLTAELDRIAAQIVDLEDPLAGTALLDGPNLWVGTANGDLLQLERQSLKPLWRFVLPGGGGLGKEILGALRSHSLEGSRTLLSFVTKDGHLGAAEAGRKEPVWLAELGKDRVPRAEAALLRLSFAGDRRFLVLAAGSTLVAYDVASGVPLDWGGKLFAPPKPFSTTPATLDRESLLLIGCTDGNLYGLKSSDGSLARKWTSGGPALRGTPLVTAQHLVASSDDGHLYFFEHGGGHFVFKLKIGGPMSGPPLVHEGLALFGTASQNGFFGVDLARQVVRFAYTEEHIEGGVTTPPTLKDQRVYFGTDAGHFYALEESEGRYVLAWSYKAKGQTRPVSAPVVIDNRVVFITANGKVFVFEE